MKQKRFSLRCFALLAFLAICSLGIAQMPTGFPTMPNTGNQAADAQAYEQAKLTWLANNPSQPVNAGSPEAPVTTPTEADNAAYEAAKVQQNTHTVSQADLAAHQLSGLQGFLTQNGSELKSSNPRLVQAYISALDMAQGQTTVQITAEQYATFHQELKDLVDANTALFNVTQ